MRLHLPALICGLLALVVATGAVGAAEPSSEPILRIETGFHTAQINRVDAAQDGAILTVSDDKTARLWRVEGTSFIQVQVLRVPIGPGVEGQLSAGAISLDGRWVAVGGDIGDSHFIYLFDRRTSALMRRIGSLPEGICHLRFRPDGQALVAGMLGGIQVFTPATGVLVWEDVYPDQSYGACWLPDGGLATTCTDGQIRGYDAQGRRRFEVTSRSGKLPYAIASDNQGTLAVGFADTTAVARLRAVDGTVLDDLDTRGLIAGALGRVAWVAGQWWAGGSYSHRAPDGTESNPVLRWSTQGRQAGAASNNAIMDHCCPTKEV